MTTINVDFAYNEINDVANLIKNLRKYDCNLIGLDDIGHWCANIQGEDSQLLKFINEVWVNEYDTPENFKLAWGNVENFILQCREKPIIKDISKGMLVSIKYGCKTENQGVYDVLKMKKANAIYQDKLGYSLFECMTQEEYKNKKDKKVVIWSDDKGNLQGWDYLKFVRKNGTVLNQNF